MAIDVRPALRTAISCFYVVACAGASAAPPVERAARVGVLDARQPEAPQIVLASAAVRNGLELRYLSLSAPMSSRSSCCVSVADAVDTGIERIDGKRQEAPNAWTGHFTASVPEPFVGLVFTHGPASVTRLGPRRMLLRWADTRGQLRVEHCLSQEGMHVRMSEQNSGGRWDEVAHYYLPLGMDVVPNCPVAGAALAVHRSLGG